jgi:NitT/TauT family transport system substrate-binding protein
MRMIPALRSIGIAALLQALVLLAGPASAEDTIKVAVSNLGFWSVETPRVGQQGGIFKKHGLILDIYGTAGAGETLQAVIAGSADIGIGLGTSGAMSAFQKGAPIRIVGSNFTGAGDLFWYVKTDSPLKSLRDATENTTVGFSSNGSSTHIALLTLLKELGSKGKAQPGGSVAATLTQVMTGQLDVGYSAPPFALQEVEDGKLRIIASGNDAPSLRDQTVRVDIASLQFIEKRREVLDRFRVAYKEALDWMYADPKAIALWSASINVSPKLGQMASDRFQTKESRTYDRFTGLDTIMTDAIQAKLLTRKLTPEELDRLIMKPPM